MSLDEIPQLINVIKGEMSIVGPRPPVFYELGDYETLNARYKKRFAILPGITGLAQVEGRNNITWDRKVDYDNQYIELIKERGLLIDVKIIFKTIFNVFQKKDIFENKIDTNSSDEQSAAEAAADVIAKAHAIEKEPL
jgi:lipopolysaccharide/colanic/teichoic acid biosynthesis glycosyltransferase